MNPQEANQAFPEQKQGIQNNKEWSTGLCDCFEDPRNCCMTLFCPCVTVGRNARVLDQGTTSCFASAIIFNALGSVGFPSLYTCGYRTKLRNLYSLKEAPCGDCCTHFWCELCAICQEYRELKNHGIDPSISWQENLEKQNRGESTMPPPVAAGMQR